MEGKGTCAMSWSTNCAHCITDDVNCGSGSSKSTIALLLICLTLGRGLPSTLFKRGCQTPEKEILKIKVNKNLVDGGYKDLKNINETKASLHAPSL